MQSNINDYITESESITDGADYLYHEELEIPDLRIIGDNTIKKLAIYSFKNKLHDKRFENVGKRILNDIYNISKLSIKQRNCLIGLIRKNYEHIWESYIDDLELEHLEDEYYLIRKDERRYDFDF